MEELLKLLLDEQLKIQRSLAEYPTVDYPSYLRRVGTYEGLQLALSHINNILSGAEKDLDL